MTDQSNTHGPHQLIEFLKDSYILWLPPAYILWVWVATHFILMCRDAIVPLVDPMYMGWVTCAVWVSTFLINTLFVFALFRLLCEWITSLFNRSKPSQPDTRSKS